MKIHKRTRLTLTDREELWKLHYARKHSQSELAEIFRVSRQTISKILQRYRGQEFMPRSSVNNRFRSLQYGLKRLKKVEFEIEQKKKSEAKRYNKSYPGELVHFDTKRLPLIKGENKFSAREYLFVAIDDFSRELYAAILFQIKLNSLLLISCIRWSMNVLTLLNALTLTMARNTRELVIMPLFLFYMTTR